MNLLLKSSIFSLLGIASSVFSLEQKAHLLSDQSKVIYNVSNGKKLDGAYQISTPEDKITLRGSYREGKRIGNWYSFNSDGKLFSRYNYDQGKLLFLDKSVLRNVLVDIKDLNDVESGDAIIPFPICSMDLYVSLLAVEIRDKILQENKSAYGVLDVDLIADIDEKGKASYSARYQTGNIKTTKRLIINDKIFELDWIPASYKGKDLRSRFIVKSKIDLNANGPSHKRFLWAY